LSAGERVITKGHAIELGATGIDPEWVKEEPKPEPEPEPELELEAVSDEVEEAEKPEKGPEEPDKMAQLRKLAVEVSPSTGGSAAVHLASASKEPVFPVLFGLHPLYIPLVI
jgi:hypothetical protein